MLESKSRESRNKVRCTLSASVPTAPNKSINRGSQPHKSYDDPSDKEDVISVRFKDSEDKRVATAHLHKDGSSKVVRW